MTPGRLLPRAFPGVHICDYERILRNNEQAEPILLARSIRSVLGSGTAVRVASKSTPEGSRCGAWSPACCTTNVSWLALTPESSERPLRGTVSTILQVGRPSAQWESVPRAPNATISVPLRYTDVVSSAITEIEPA